MVAMRDPSSTAFAVGRFAGWEPLGFEAGDDNWYRFVANGPTGKADPSGLNGDANSAEQEPKSPGGLEPLIIPGRPWPPETEDVGPILFPNGFGQPLGLPTPSEWPIREPRPPEFNASFKLWDAPCHRLHLGPDSPTTPVVTRQYTSRLLPHEIPDSGHDAKAAWSWLRSALLDLGREKALEFADQGGLAKELAGSFPRLNVPCCRPDDRSRIGWKLGSVSISRSGDGRIDARFTIEFFYQ